AIWPAVMRADRIRLAASSRECSESWSATEVRMSLGVSTKLIGTGLFSESSSGQSHRSLHFSVTALPCPLFRPVSGLAPVHGRAAIPVAVAGWCLYQLQRVGIW